MRMRVFNVVLFAGCVCVRLAGAQELLDEVNFRANQLAGIHLVGISVYSGYSSNALPQSGYSLTSSGNVGNLGADYSYGGSASLGWQLHREKTNAAIMYTGSYGGMVRYSGVDGYSQSLSVSASRSLSPKWILTFNGSGADSTIAQYLFNPGALNVITQVPATFDDLAAAFAAGQFSSSQAASILTGAPLMQAAGRSLLVGNRILSYTGRAGVEYTASSRLHFHFGSFAAAGQTRFGDTQSGTPLNVVMPRSLGADAGAGLSYSLSPRTQVGFDVEANRTVNHYQSVYVSTATASLGRKMGEHWFLHLQGGGTYDDVLQETLGTPRTRQIVGSGSFGFQTKSNTLIASYSRTGSDEFGLAVGTITTASGAWNWHPAGSRWSASASFGQQQTRDTGFISLSGWEATGGLTNRASMHTNLSLQYSYLSSKGNYAGNMSDVRIHSIRLSFGWTPQALDR
jgi:hypothetical protein